MTEKHGELSHAFNACRSAFMFTGLFSFFINLLMLTGPLFMLQVYDRVLTSRSIPTLIALTVLVICLYLFMALLEFVRSRLLVRVGRRLDEQLSGRVFEAIISHALRRTPHVGSQPARDLDTLRQFVAGPGPFAFFDAPWTPVYIAVIFLLHTWLGIFAVVGGTILFIFALLNEMLTRTPSARANQSAIAAHTMTEESRRNAESIGAMGMTNAMRDRWLAQHNAALDDNTHASDRAGTITAMSKATRLMMQSGILGLGAYLAVLQEITPGTMIAASIILSRALNPIEQAITQWRGFIAARKANGRIKTVLAAAPAEEPPMDLPQPEGRFAAENLIVTAPGLDKPLLQGLNFQLEPGEAVGVLGPSGAGKSTLSRALVGVWPILKGTVRLDGASLDQWNPEQLGKAVGYLPQDVELFSGTVAENISRFSADPDAEAVVKAAKLADVHEMILRLPEGYSTRIGEGGSALSAGQRQRVGLARALYGDPKVVVLDEPNANLDSDGEAAVIHAIQALKAAGTTVVVVAHRPSAIHAVDKILFIREGRQLAFGPRDEILAKILKSPAGGPQQMGTANVAAAS